MDDYSYLTLSRPAPSVLCVALNRPDAANALNAAMADEISHVFQSEMTEAVIVLTGAGSRAFCAGADMKERRDLSDAAWEAHHFRLRAARNAILNSPKPVIAAVNGGAYGGGLELALSCDFVYAATSARFALPEAKLGIMPGLGGAQFLSRAIGPSRALEYLLTGNAFGAEEALRLGLISRVCEDQALMQEALASAEAVAQNAPMAVHAIRQAVRQSTGLKLEKALADELTLYHALLTTHDRHEGTNAFLEKRKPVFTGS